MFCCRKHRTQARVKKREFELKFLGRCSKPFKRRFETPLAAYEFAERMHHRNQHPYLCKCGGWHLTSQAPNTWQPPSS